MDKPFWQIRLVIKGRFYMKDRITRIMEFEEMGQAQFAAAIGIQRAAMSHIISGRNNPSLDVITKILDRFPIINPDWLLFEKGEMLRESSSDDSQDKSLLQTPPNIQVLPNEAAGQSSGYPNCVPNQLPLDKQMLLSVDKVSRSIDKIVVFYSDNTFDTFIPEKTEQE